jgi:single-strand selective monofunctional uracil DNA glycosylase
MASGANRIREAAIDAAARLRDAVDALRFSAPVAHVYNPLHYAWDAHRNYLRAYAAGHKDIVFLGMNPGPWGMAQTGVPFGEIAAVRDWLHINGTISRPELEHAKRPVQGFACHRSEVSGRRLWGLFRERYGSPRRFFASQFVANYCPLVFMEQSGRNRTPDKLPANERNALFEACDEHIRRLCETFRCRWVVAVGAFAEKRARSALEHAPVSIVRILHPSPASPAANSNWAVKVTEQLTRAGLWQPK